MGRTPGLVFVRFDTRLGADLSFVYVTALDDYVRIEVLTDYDQPF
jgi:hypothetical protein